MTLVSDEQRFVWDINDLQEITHNPQPRNLLAASGILRRLLLDDEALLHKVARGRDFKAKFVVFGNEVDPALESKVLSIPGPQFQLTNPAFNQTSGGPKRHLDLDKFLRERIAYMGTKPITVKELVNYTANVGGGVHQGKPRKRDNAETIHATAHNVLIDAKPYPMQAMLWIATITVNALLPLYWRLRS